MKNAMVSQGFSFAFFAALIALGGCAGQNVDGAGEPESQAARESAQATAAASDGETSVVAASKLATFEGQVVDLSKGRGEAHACLVLSSDNVECFRTGVEAEARMAEIEADEPASASEDESNISALLCSSFACFYQHSNYGGAWLCLRERRVEINFSAYGFDNMTSSYHIGACNVTLWSGSSNTGSKRVASAGTSSSYVGDSWNDITSSVWIW